MASKHKNPYRDGSKYAEIFAVIRSKQVVTRQELIGAGFSIHDITVVLSPRDEGASTRGGDARGNLSARGEDYFMEKLKKVKGEAQRFRLRWRSESLARRVRPPKVEQESQKTGGKKTSAPAPAEAPAEATAEAEAPAEATA